MKRVALRPTFGCVTDTVLALLNIFSRSMLPAAIVYQSLMLVQLQVTLHVQLQRINRFLHNYSVSTPRHFKSDCCATHGLHFCRAADGVLRENKKVHLQTVSR